MALNLIYEDFLHKIHERVWGLGHPVHENIDYNTFASLLQEIAVAAWHSGDARHVTAAAIEKRCSQAGKKNLWEQFEGKARECEVPLIMLSFFFRSAHRISSAERRFEFTHKSFSEYLIARRLLELVRDIHEERNRNRDNPGKGWTVPDALLKLIEICGPAPLDFDIFDFVLREAAQDTHSPDAVKGWQLSLCELMRHQVRASLPMEKTDIRTFQEMQRQALNAELNLMALINACARRTRAVSLIDWPDEGAFGRFLSRQYPQIVFLDNTLLRRIVSHQDLLWQMLHGRYLQGINLNKCNLEETDFSFTDLTGANLSGAKLSGVNLIDTNLSGADLSEADLSGANLSGADLSRADLIGADLSRAKLNEADLRGADLRGADLSGANLSRADLRGAKVAPEYLEGAVTEGAIPPWDD